MIAPSGFAAEPFYQGKTLRVIVASAAGGGSDIVGRLMMRHLPRHIPGNPTIVVENMPGAGEIIGTNYVYGKVKADGLTALFATGTPINQLLELPGIEFDVTKMPIIGGSSESVAAFIRTDKTGVKSARDLLNPKRAHRYWRLRLRFDQRCLDAGRNEFTWRKKPYLRDRLRRRRPDPSRL
jgi:tripartite-type tricarboxylate transporter receptor subunit TctC